IMLMAVLIVVWGVTAWSLVRTLKLEGRKAGIIRRAGDIEHYSPKALHDLEMWLAQHPHAPEAEVARRRLEETRLRVERTKPADRFYRWPPIT
ncbi:MAG: hypothetical protein ACE5HC_16180, partial [Candidatus Binatia bacterium]